MPRLFVAIDFPDPVRQQLALLCHGLPDTRWMPQEQLHLTLRFIGDVDGATFLDLQDALEGVHHPPFELSLKGTGHFPPRGEPRMLWAGVAPGEGLSSLHHQVERTVVAAGLEPDHRNYFPHVTLARLRKTPPRRVADYLAHHALFSAGPFGVNSFHLYASHLTPAGAIHDIQASYPLTPGPGTGEDHNQNLPGTHPEAAE
ncbi:MAG: RNA 2',3'-cyclic phosphodiesterase [Leptospirillia bacterium]